MENTKYIKYFFSLLMVFFLVSIACTTDTATRKHQSTEFRGETIRPASLDNKNSMIQTAIFEYIAINGYGKNVKDVNGRIQFADPADIVRRFTVTEDDLDTTKERGDAGMGSSNSRIHVIFAWDDAVPLPANAKLGSTDPTVIISDDIVRDHPELAAVLNKWDFSDAPMDNLEQIARQFREAADRWIAYEEVAIYFLLRNEGLWTPWVNADAKAKIDAELAREQGLAAQQKK
tara:strand:- start:1169 stop:1864 length:696 start_codon:yes stop_codon:yes gene_type:complete